jgi:hypothetical protein
MPYQIIPGLLPSQLAPGDETSGKYIQGPNGHFYPNPVRNPFLGENKTPWLMWVPDAAPPPPAPRPRRQPDQMLQLFPATGSDLERATFLTLMGRIAAEDLGAEISTNGVVHFDAGGISYLPDFTSKPWGLIADSLFERGFDPSQWKAQAYVSVANSGFPGGMHWAKESIFAVKGPDYEGRHSFTAMGANTYILAEEISAAIKAKKQHA